MKALTAKPIVKAKKIPLSTKSDNSTVLIPKYRNEQKKEVWLSFDDGPQPSNTDQILKILDRHKIKATFFVIGQNVARHPKVVRRTFDAGHRIGNHTYTHPYLPKISEKAIKKEIVDTDRLIAAYQEPDKKLFRPPYGAYNLTVDSIVRGLGYRSLFWSLDTLDWSSHYQPGGWVEHGIEQVRNRDQSLILNHDIHKSTADNLSEFILGIVAMRNVSFQSPWTL